MAFSLRVSNLVRKFQDLTSGGKDPLIGLVLGPPGQEVKIVEQLGTGTMGRVYKACQGSLQRPVAVKFLARAYKSDDPDSSKRFYNEARAVAQLRSPHIVQVHYVGHYDDLPYLVMEYIDGVNLEQFLHYRERLEPSDALNIVRQVLKGLAQAHERGKLHRDIKPANIMVSNSGTVVVLDFGLVRDSAGSRVTLEDEILGTPLYVSPEQIEGELIDCRTDIYAVGIILYELLTGSPPFDGRDYISVLRKHVEEPLPDPTKFEVHIDPCLMHLLERMTAKNPEDRYSSAREAIIDIDDYLNRLAKGAPCPQHLCRPKPQLGVAINHKGKVVAQLGSIGTRVPRSLHLLNSIIPELKALENLGEFNRGTIGSQADRLLVFPHGSGLAALSGDDTDELKELETLECEALAECFEGEETRP